MLVQSSDAVLSLYISVVHSLSHVVGVRRLLADSIMHSLLQRVVRPSVWCLQQYI